MNNWDYRTVSNILAMFCDGERVLISGLIITTILNNMAPPVNKYLTLLWYASTYFSLILVCALLSYFLISKDNSGVAVLKV